MKFKSKMKKLKQTRIT